LQLLPDFLSVGEVGLLGFCLLLIELLSDGSQYKKKGLKNESLSLDFHYSVKKAGNY